MGLTPIEIFLHALLGFSALMLFLLLAWNIARFSRRKVRQWQLSRRRRPDEFLALRAENSRLKAEHAMMASRLEQAMQGARAHVADKQAEAARAINRAGLLAEELAEARDTIAARDGAIRNLEQALQETRDELAEARERARQLFAERSELMLNLQERTQAFEQASQELKLHKQQMQALEQELKELRRHHADSRQQVKTLLAQRRDLQKQVTSLQQALERSREDMQRLEREIAEERAGFIRQKLDHQERIDKLSALLAEMEEKQASAHAGPQLRAVEEQERASA